MFLVCTSYKELHMYVPYVGFIHKTKQGICIYILEAQVTPQDARHDNLSTWLLHCISLKPVVISSTVE